MTTELLALDWQLLRLFDGESEPRISDLALGERLGYALTNRSNIRKVIKRLTERGDLRGDAVKTVCISRTAGAATRVVRELWLTQDAAVIVALDVRTPKSRTLRDAIVKAFSDYRDAQPLARVEPIEARLTTNLVTALAEALRPLLLARAEPTSIYVTREQIDCLQAQARGIAEVRGDQGIRRVWKETMNQLCLVPSRTPFATVQRRMFDQLWDDLHAQYNTLKQAKAYDAPPKPSGKPRLSLVKNPPKRKPSNRAPRG